MAARSDSDGNIISKYEDESGYPFVDQVTSHVAMVKKLLEQC